MAGSPALSRSPSPSSDYAQSTTALILVPDGPEHDSDDLELQLDFTPEDGDDGQDDFSAPSTSQTSLSPSIVFLYLLSPFLKLGALSIPFGLSIELSYSIPALLFFAAASLFTRQVWYLLARYVRKTSAEGVVMDAFARASGKRLQRSVIRAVVRLVASASNVLLVGVYFRGESTASYTSCHAY